MGGGNSNQINSWSGQALHWFANQSVRADSAIEQYKQSAAGYIGQGASAVSQGEANVWDHHVQSMSNELGIEPSYLDRHMTSPFRPGPLSKAFQFAGGALEAATGIISTGKALHADLQSGDRTYSGTMKSVFTSVLKTSAASAAGYGAAALVAGAGATVGLPVVAAVGAAVGAGYLIDKGIGWFFG